MNPNPLADWIGNPSSDGKPCMALGAAIPNQGGLTMCEKDSHPLTLLGAPIPNPEGGSVLGCNPVTLPSPPYRQRFPSDATW